MNDLARTIARATADAGKDYAFAQDHDRHRPAQVWFQTAPEGLVLFLVFYTQACRWSRCLGCNLPSLCCGQHVDYKALMAQVDHVFAQPEIKQTSAEIRKVIISNNGSVLDQETFSSTALVYLLACMNLHLPNVAVVSLETRPEYVEVEELEFLARVLAEGETVTQLELAVGMEAYDEHIRNDVFGKGLALQTLETLAALLGKHGFAIKVYYMQKPVPGLSDEAAVADVQRGIDYLADLGRRYQVPVNLHLNPTYAASGTPLAAALARGEFSPPYLRDVARAVVHARGSGLTVFVGLYDEGLAVDGGSFLRPEERDIQQALDRFNSDQDFTALADIC